MIKLVFSLNTVVICYINMPRTKGGRYLNKKVVATTLICYLPEIGSLKAKQIAKLAGLAPINCDSGKKQGKRFIQGGRMQVRRALYMSIITAKEFNSYIRSFFNRLTNQAKKPFKVVATAAMRKLLILANALIRDNRSFYNS